MTKLSDLIPDIDSILMMSSADLSGYVLESLTGSFSKSFSREHRGNFCSRVENEYPQSTNEKREQMSIAISAAWTWLEVNGLICPDPGANSAWHVMTKLGHNIRSRGDVRKFLSNQELPEHILHFSFLADVRPLYLQGRFDTAVFEAFKGLEVHVRCESGFGQDKVGITLMNAAFHPDDGPLTDRSLERGERHALMLLMSGAIGSYKNPTSHRKIALLSDEAREMIVLASHLMKIVDSRASERGKFDGQR